jgi:hypothetical protein
MKIRRSDRCYLTGIRAIKLTDAQAVRAWRSLAHSLADMGEEQDVPKFNGLLRAIRQATISVRQSSNIGVKSESI